MGQAILLNKSSSYYSTSSNFFEEEVSWTFNKVGGIWQLDGENAEFINTHFKIKNGSKYLFRLIDKSNEMYYIAQAEITADNIVYYHNEFENISTPIDIYISNNCLHLINFESVSSEKSKYVLNCLLIEVASGGDF